MLLRERLMQGIVSWLTEECQQQGMPMSDFANLREQVRPGDVLLVEGRTRVSGVIQTVTLSSWSHSALYVGRVRDLPDNAAVASLVQAHDWSPNRQLLVEAELGHGTVLRPLDNYRGYHLRICRPQHLTAGDARAVVSYAIERLGTPYDLRQILDLLRFFFPYGLLPRRWRSSLFEAGYGQATRTVCSTLIAEAFASVRYPILPIIQRGEDGGHVFVRRNSKLFTPRDFDYSPYFEIIKYPFLGDDVALYRDLHWEEDVVAEQPLPAAESARPRDR